MLAGVDPAGDEGTSWLGEQEFADDDAEDRLASHPPAAGTVVVAGRPNVGKSSLVNRIVGRRAAIVEELPGVTRDRNELEADWAGTWFRVVDTGGWLEDIPASGAGQEDGQRQISRLVSAQTERALDGASVVLLVVDVITGMTREDEALARLLRRHGCEVMVIANKVDSVEREADAWQFVRLGLGDPWMVSALHGRCVGDMLDEVVRRLVAERHDVPGTPERHDVPGTPERHDVRAEPSNSVPGVAIVGRPNVGKSTLFNRLAGSERAVTSPQPGTTRDAIDTVVATTGGDVRYIDTAGMRRRSHVNSTTELYSVVRSLRALERADIALLVIDASAGVAHQDQRIAERIEAMGRACVVVLNKWDQIGADARQDVLAAVGEKLAFIDYANVIKVSALTGKGIRSVVPAIWDAWTEYCKRVSTGELNRALRSMQEAHPPPDGRVLYGVQAVSRPPTFTLFASRRLPEQYLRYMSRRLRRDFGFGATPLKFRVRVRTRK